MRLKEILSFYNKQDNPEITGISFDSRLVKAGDLFFVIPGAEQYIEDAISKGAKAIVTENSSYTQYILARNVRIALAESCAKFFKPNPKYITAVTGTNGKTSVVHYFVELCSLLGIKAASVGTMGLLSNIEIKDSGDIPSLTTPDIVSMYRIMSTAAKSGAEYFIFEASSHGIDQKRIYGIELNAAAFTNITHDHLDYHKTFEQYKEAKLKLFTENLAKNGTAIISSDMEFASEIVDYVKKAGRRVLTVGTHGDVKITNIKQDIFGQKIDFSYKNKNYSFKTKILGSFQASNLIMAALLLEQSGIEFENIIDLFEQLKAPRGRLERVESKNQDYHLFIDYAHTPDALKKSISELKKLAVNRKLITLFGCGGDRDKTKRKIMGNIAAKLSDIVIITDDNPRTEDPATIRSEIITGTSNEIEIAGRDEAIKYAISKMEKGDILLIAGKGHEDYQIIGTTKIHFDDAEIARKFLMEKI